MMRRGVLVLAGLVSMTAIELTVLAQPLATEALPLNSDPDGRAGHLFFEELGCPTCHVETITTALGNKIIHPFLPHDIETGDGIVQAGPQDKPDQRSSRLQNAIERHLGEARQMSARVEAMSNAEKQQLFSFLSSL